MRKRSNAGEIIRRAIEFGRLHGFVTFDQLDELLSSQTDRTAPKDIESVMEALSDEGINVVEGNQVWPLSRSLSSPFRPGLCIKIMQACTAETLKPGFDPSASCVS